MKLNIPEVFKIFLTQKFFFFMLISLPKRIELNSESGSRLGFGFGLGSGSRPKTQIFFGFIKYKKKQKKFFKKFQNFFRPKKIFFSFSISLPKRTVLNSESGSRPKTKIFLGLMSAGWVLRIQEKFKKKFFKKFQNFFLPKFFFSFDSESGSRLGFGFGLGSGSRPKPKFFL